MNCNPKLSPRYLVTLKCKVVNSQVKTIYVKFARKSAQNSSEFTKIALAIRVVFWNLFPSGIRTDLKRILRVKIRLNL